MMQPWSRRAFLQWTAVQATALSAAQPAATTLTWQPLQLKGKPKKIVILGAGLAGLSAGLELVDAGHDVTILEGSLRAGGRVYTMRHPFSDGLHAEAGALHIASTHNFTLHYVRKFNLPLVPFPQQGRAACYYLNNRRIALQPGAVIDWRLPLAPDEAKLGVAELFTKYLQAPTKEIGDPLAEGWPNPALAKYDKMSFADLLAHQKASPAAQYLISLGYLEAWGDRLDALSALAVLRELALSFSAPQHFGVKGGNDRLPAALAERLKERIHYGVPVIAVDQADAAVRVTVRTPAGGQRVFHADRAICTLPFSVLKDIKGTNRFSDKKCQAIKELTYTPVTRVHMQTRSRFWNPQGQGVTAITDLPIMMFIDDSLGEPGPRGMLNCYVTGAQARKLDAQTEQQRLSTALASINKVFPEMAEQYEGGATFSWDQNPWSRGAYCAYKPGQLTGLMPHIVAPEGRIHFAGEHTSPWPGWMQGALYSGNRVAREVNEVP